MFVLLLQTFTATLNAGELKIVHVVSVNVGLIIEPYVLAPKNDKLESATKHLRALESKPQRFCWLLYAESHSNLSLEVFWALTTIRQLHRADNTPGQTAKPWTRTQLEQDLQGSYSVGNKN